MQTLICHVMVGACMKTNCVVVAKWQKMPLTSSTDKEQRLKGYCKKTQQPISSPAPNNMCICCGEIIPEGRQVCPACEKQLKNYKPKGVKTKTIGKYVASDLGVQLTINDMENNL